MAKKLCIAIAVSKPEGLDEIPGAIPSATRIARWACSQGYETRLVTDKERPVTCERLAKIFHARLGGGGHDRIIVSFAGHGLIRGGAEEYWLLNGWRTRATEAVNYLKLRDRLGTYRPKQLAVISDACRSLPNDRAKWVEGNGVVDVKDYVEAPVQVAQLTGTRSAQPAFATPLGAEEAYCFFTQVLVNALEGSPAEIVKTDVEGRRVVEHDRLFDIVEQELPRLAGEYRRTQIPELNGSWRAPANIWSVLPKKEPQEEAPILGPPAGAADPGSHRGEFLSEKADIVAEAVQEMADKLHTENRPTHFETETGLAFIGAPVRDVVTSRGFSARRDINNANWFQLTPHRPSASVLAQLDDDTWVGAAAYRGFIGSFSINDDGAESYVLRPVWSDHSFAVEAVAKAAMGADLGDPFELAARLRDHKHADPVLGALASYVYARAGAIDEIRRLCYFYAKRGQPAPFDTVLLARVPIRRHRGGYWVADLPSIPAREPRNEAETHRAFTYRSTPSARVRVAGGFPWLRQGWALLEDDFRPEFRRLAEYAAGLRPSLFSSFLPAVGELLAKAVCAGEI